MMMTAQGHGDCAGGAAAAAKTTSTALSHRAFGVRSPAYNTY